MPANAADGPIAEPPVGGLLAAEQIAAALRELPGWRHQGSEIEASYRLPSFPLAIALVDQVAVIAEAAAHHPDIDIRWRTVRFVLSTHDAGGITTRDVALAREIAALAADGDGQPA